MAAAFPTAGRLLGIDFGTVRIGLAISDQGQRLASPLCVHQRGPDQQTAGYFRQVIADQQIVGLVVGLPIHNSGAASQKSRQAIRFARWLEVETAKPVVLFDERFTTALARQLLQQANLSGKKRKARLDKIAAQVLLAAYLESPHQAVPLDRADTATDSLEDHP